MARLEVLLVDDHAETVRALARKWRASCVVHCANTHAEALAVARGRAVEIAIVDLFLPQPTGLELIAQLKESREIYAVLASASMSIEWAHAAHVADDVLPKPFTLAEVLLRRSERASRAETLHAHRTLTLERAEFEYLRRVLSECSQNKSLAARRLNISRTRLERILRRYDEVETQD